MLIGKYIFFIYLSLFIIKMLGAHAHLSICWRVHGQRKFGNPCSSGLDD